MSRNVLDSVLTTLRSPSALHRAARKANAPSHTVGSTLIFVGSIPQRPSCDLGGIEGDGEAPRRTPPCDNSRRRTTTMAGSARSQFNRHPAPSGCARAQDGVLPSCRQSRPPFAPKIRNRSPLSFPDATWLAHNAPRAGGAAHFAATIATIRATSPVTTIEILPPHFLRKVGPPSNPGRKKRRREHARIEHVGGGKRARSQDRDGRRSDRRDRSTDA
jgi:hypothetical protein